jgi:hypothetical protein
MADTDACSAKATPGRSGVAMLPAWRAGSGSTWVVRARGSTAPSSRSDAWRGCGADWTERRSRISSNGPGRRSSRSTARAAVRRPVTRAGRTSGGWNQAVCGIRWTPDEREVGANPYYGWVVEGLCLYEALGRRGVPAIEVFPTASWTRWLGPRGNRSRAAWTTAGLAALPLDGLPVRSNQDVRDAIAAAVTARAHARGMTEAFGEIVVPLGGYFEGDVAGARRQDHGLHRGVQPA